MVSCKAASTEAATDSSSSSLIPETLQQMESDTELQATLAALKTKGQAALSREEAKARKRSLQHLNLPSFTDKLQVGWVMGLGFLECVFGGGGIGGYLNRWAARSGSRQQDSTADGVRC